jgi:hypothetical protein
MSILHSITWQRSIAALVAAIALCLLIFVVIRITENPERKAARKLLAHLFQRGLNITAIQLDHLGKPAFYEQANALFRQAREPEADARKAFKEKRYKDALELGAEALELVNEANRIQSSNPHCEC